MYRPFPPSNRRAVPYADALISALRFRDLLIVNINRYYQSKLFKCRDSFTP
jgi:hypothetical protein